jgi:glycerol-3-phosphate dehydrogenase
MSECGAFQVMEDYLSRDEQIIRLRREAFDVAVIGGGINGAAVARDAALRGLKVALIDRGDFAGQTSSRSSKLIHGGLRYLPQGQLRLVYEALRERERLQRLTAPHLVRPMAFLFPLYEGMSVSRLALRAGLTIYDLLARTPAAQRHRSFDAAHLAALEPGLKRDGLKGGALYYDGYADDARLTFENVLDAALHGAAAANYVALEGFEKYSNRLAAAQVTDVAGGERFALRASVFVNAAGPWLDDVRRMDEPGARPAIRLTKGVHLVIAARRLALRHSLVLSDGQGRIVFLIREGESILLGTTDTDFSGDRARVRASREDVEYLLKVVEESIPGARLEPADIIASFAGLRALVAAGDGAPPSKVPREEMVIAGARGLLSVAGGKLTTHRRIAERVVDTILRELGRAAGKSPTRAAPLPGAKARPGAHGAMDELAPALRAELASRYGTRIALIEALISEQPRLAEPLCAGAPVLAAEAVHAARFEMAIKLEDFMVRRTAMARRYPAQAQAAACAAAPLLGAELGWSSAREASELAEFAAALQESRAF